MSWANLGIIHFMMWPAISWNCHSIVHGVVEFYLEGILSYTAFRTKKLPKNCTTVWKDSLSVEYMIEYEYNQRRCTDETPEFGEILK